MIQLVLIFILLSLAFLTLMHVVFFQTDTNKLYMYLKGSVLTIEKTRVLFVTNACV